MRAIERDIKRAVVTGPTGAIGSALCRRLPEAGIEVYAVCRPDSPRMAALPESERLHPVMCDAGDFGSLPGLVHAPVDAFFHLAWTNTTGVGRNDMTAQIQNIRATIDAVRAAGALGCRVFVGAGSQAEYGRPEEALRPETPCFPENGYGMAKLCAGQMSRVECRRLGIGHIWMRVLSVYGPRDGEGSMVSYVIRTLLGGGKPCLTAGEQLWDYLYADDAAQAFYLAARSGQSGAVYTLGSGCPRPLREYVELMRDSVDPELPLGFGAVPYSPQQVMRLEADITALQRDTGFFPQMGFAEGIRKTVEWMRKEPEMKNGKRGDC